MAAPNSTFRPLRDAGRSCIGSTLQHLNSLASTASFAADTSFTTRSLRLLHDPFFHFFRLCFRMVCFRWRCARFLQGCSNQVVTGSSSVNKCKHVIVRVAFTNYLDKTLTLQLRQLLHQEVLLRNAHVSIGDVERETRRMWWRIDRHSVPVYSPQRVLILLRPHQRTHRQRTIKLQGIRRRYLLDDLQRLRSNRAQHVDLQHMTIVWIFQIEGAPVEVFRKLLQRLVFVRIRSTAITIVFVEFCERLLVCALADAKENISVCNSWHRNEFTALDTCAKIQIVLNRVNLVLLNFGDLSCQKPISFLVVS